MLELTEPQVWVLIAAFTASVLGMLTWQTISFTRALRLSSEAIGARIDGLRDTTDIRFAAVETRMSRLDERLGGVESRLSAVESKLDGVDRDVRALTRHVFGADPH